MARASLSLILYIDNARTVMDFTADTCWLLELSGPTLFQRVGAKNVEHPKTVERAFK